MRTRARIARALTAALSADPTESVATVQTPTAGNQGAAQLSLPF